MRPELQLLPFRIDPLSRPANKELAVIKTRTEHGTLAILNGIRTQLDRWAMGQSRIWCPASQRTLPWVLEELPKLVRAIRI